MKEVVLTNGDLALVDNQDFDCVSRYRWYANPKRTGIYAVAEAGGETIGMHRLILGLTKGDGLHGDHIDGNGLNNQRSNLRVATRADNQHNQANRVPLRDLFADHRILSECHGEAIIVGDRAAIDEFNVLLDAIEAEIGQRSESEMSAYEAQRWLKGRAS